MVGTEFRHRRRPKERERERSPVKKNWGGWLVGWLITTREKNGNEEMKTLES